MVCRLTNETRPSSSLTLRFSKKEQFLGCTVPREAPPGVCNVLADAPMSQ